MRNELLNYAVAKAGAGVVPNLVRQNISFLDTDEEILEKSYVNELVEGTISTRYLNWVKRELASERLVFEQRIHTAIEEMTQPRYSLSAPRRKRVALIQASRERLAQLVEAERWVDNRIPSLDVTNIDSSEQEFIEGEVGLDVSTIGSEPVPEEGFGSIDMMDP